VTLLPTDDDIGPQRGRRLILASEADPYSQPLSWREKGEARDISPDWGREWAPISLIAVIDTDSWTSSAAM
jgi:hypothetical protein